MSQVSINVKDAVTPMLQRVSDSLVKPEKLHKKIGMDILALVRRHMRGIAETRHASARRLGASPSGFWSSPVKYTEMTSSAESALVTITHPGIGRATHDVSIRPTGGKKWLTIPIDRSGYNQRAYRMQDLVFVHPPGKSFALLGRRESSGNRSASMRWIYLLVRSVHQKQDSTLVPPPEAFLATAAQSASEFIDDLIARRAA